MEITSLWQHQSEGIKRAGHLLDSGYNGFAFFFEPGLGKTRTVLETLRKVYAKHGKIIPTIIFCPPVAIPNWRNEILKYTKIKEERIHMLDGTQLERIETMKAANPDSIFITNYEALLMKNLYEEMTTLVNKNTTALILDEAHKVKSHDSKRTKAMIQLSRKCHYKYLLTGTPILNELWDIWALYMVMDNGKTFGDSFWAFRAKYYRNLMANVPNVKFPKYVPVPGAVETVREKIQATSLFAEKSQCLDLPPLVKKSVEIEMSPEQKRLYNEMKKDMITSITTRQGDTKYSVAQLAVTKALRMLQVLSGHIPVQHADSGEQTVIKIKDNPRKKALEELLEDLAPYHKVIVWAVFRDNYDDIADVCNGLKIEYVTLTGETKDREDSITRFNNDPKVRVLIGHPRSGGIAVNLIEASYMVYYSRSYSLEDDVQSEARNYRAGSEKHDKITRIDLVVPGTLDQLVLNCLASKQQLSDKVLKERLSEI